MLTRLSDGWKKALSEIMVTLGLIPGAFTGRITINFNAGAVCDVEKVERVK